MDMVYWNVLRGPEPIRSPFGTPDFTPLVDTRDRTLLVERRLANHDLQRHDVIRGGRAISFGVTFPHVG